MNDMLALSIAVIVLGVVVIIQALHLWRLERRIEELEAEVHELDPGWLP